MLYGGIDFDSKLVQAAYDGELVIFAGAGVSADDPTSLPLFKNLIKIIKAQGDRGNRLKPWDEEEPAEKYLEYLEKNNCRIRDICIAELKTDNYNILHKEIIRLFRPNNIRIVTTNFDECFENCFNDNSMCDYGHTNVYTAPALPLGSNFNGLVHVHGSISNASSMVLTASDFGKAYVSEGWASRFLVDVFESYTALFVGYRCGDILIDYLTRSISGELKDRTFALVREDEEGKEEWSSRGVNIITFKDYGDLPITIRELADDVSLTVYERADKIEQLSLSEHKLQDKDLEFLKQSLNWPIKEDRLAFTMAFCSKFNDARYFYLLDALQLNDILFKNDPDEAEHRLLRWAVSNFATSCCSQFQALCIHYNKPYLSDPLFEELIWYLSDSNIRPEDIGPWIAWFDLVQISDNNYKAYDLMALVESCDDPDIIFAITKILLKVRVSFHNNGLVKNSASSFSMLSCINDYGELTNRLINIIGKYPAVIGEQLFNYCIDQIEVAYSIQTCCWTKLNAYDSITFNRNSITSQNKDEYEQDACGVLIDVAKVCLPQINIKEMALKCIRSRCSLLIRLGIWMLDTNNIFDYGLKLFELNGVIENVILNDEFCKFTQTIFDCADDSDKEQFINYLKESRTIDANKYKDYQYYMICNQLLELAENTTLHSILDNIEKDNPEFKYYKNNISEQYIDTLDNDLDIIDKYKDIEINIDNMLNIMYQNPPFRSPVPVSEQFRSISKYRPKEVLSLIDNLVSKDCNTDEIDLEKALITTYDWTSLYSSPDELTETFEKFLQNKDVYKEAIQAITSTIFINGQTFGWTFDLLENIIKYVIDNIDNACNITSNISDDAKYDWAIYSRSLTIGQAIKLSAYLQNLIKDDNMREKYKIYVNTLIKQVSKQFKEETPNAKCVIASLSSYLNIWYEYDPAATEQLIFPLMSSNDWASVPCWQGISHLERISIKFIAGTEKHWDNLFKNIITLDQDTLDSLGKIYWQFAIRQDDPAERIQRISLCASTSSELCRSVYRQIDNWLNSLDNDQLIKEWDEWLEKVTYYLADKGDKFTDILIVYIIRWIEKYPIMRKQLIKLLQHDNMISCNNTISIIRKNIIPIVYDNDLSPNERTICITFCLDHSRHISSEKELIQALNNLIELPTLRKKERSDLLDALTRKGVQDQFN